MVTASGPVWADTQRSTHDCWVSISRKPQCTTSWSSTTSTRSRSGLRSSSVIVLVGDHEAHLPDALLALAELDDAVGLQSLERREAQPHAGAAAVGGGGPIVDDLHPERPVGPAQPHVDVGRLSV